MAAARAAVAKGVQRKTFFQGRELGRDAVVVVTPTDMQEARGRLRAILGDGQVIKNPVRNLGAIAAASETKTVVWLVPRDHIRDVISGCAASSPDEIKSMSLAVRFLGGCIADEEWIKACEEMFPVLGKVPEPIARLAAATKTPRELAVDGSVGKDATWATAVLEKAGDCCENPTSKWIVRPSRIEIRKPKEAFVLFGTEAAAAKDADKKTSAKDKIKRRQLREDLAGPKAKAKAKAKLASAKANAKTLRGTGLSVESFARTIATFV